METITHKDIKTDNILMYSHKSEEYEGIIIVYSFNRHGVRADFLNSGGRRFYRYEELHPVVLSKDIFLMLGFNEEVIDSQESVHGFSLRSNKKHNEYYEDIVIQQVNDYFTIIDYNIEFKYVHELQNIFSCISKDRLTIDLTKIKTRTSFDR